MTFLITCATVKTRRGTAFVDIDLTVSSSESLKAMTRIVEDNVFTHFGAFTARIAETFVDICLTISTFKSRVITIAFKVID